MAATFIEFQNQNANRAYPLDDTATQTADAGDLLPENILVDCRLWLPSGVRNRVYVSSVTIGPAVVSVTLYATDGRVRLPGGGPITTGPNLAPMAAAAVTVPRPIVPGRMHAVSALTPGVGGWIAFGEGVNLQPIGTLRTFRFTNHIQSLLVPSAAIFYDIGGVTSLRKEAVLTSKLRGLVKLRAGSDLEIVKATRIVDGISREVIVIRLSSAVSLERVNQYIGPCEGRPDSDTCDQPPIFLINDVAPDCAGNINIVFTQPAVRNMSNDSGMVLQTDKSLDDLCEQITPPPPFTTTIESPYLEHFNDLLPTTDVSVGDFTFRQGTWIQEFCQLRPGGTYARAVATLNMNSRGRTVKTSVRFSPFTSGLPDNGFIVFGWQSTTDFWFIGVDRDGSKLQIGRVSGSSTIILREAVITTPAFGVQHEMQLVMATLSPVSVRIEATFNAEPTITHATSLFQDGRIGLMAENGMPRFDNYRVDWDQAYPTPGPCFDAYSYGYYGLI